MTFRHKTIQTAILVCIIFLNDGLIFFRLGACLAPWVLHSKKKEKKKFLLRSLCSIPLYGILCSCFWMQECFRFSFVLSHRVLLHASIASMQENPSLQNGMINCINVFLLYIYILTKLMHYIYRPNTYAEL